MIFNQDSMRTLTENMISIELPFTLKLFYMKSDRHKFEFDSFDFKLETIWEFKLAAVRAIWKCMQWSYFLPFELIKSNRIEPNSTPQLMFNGITADIYTFCLYRHSIARNDIVGDNFSVVWQHLAGVYTGKLRSGHQLYTSLRHNEHCGIVDTLALFIPIHYSQTVLHIFRSISRIQLQVYFICDMIGFRGDFSL